MEYRTLGKTGLRVSTLGFGCGDVGGLIVRGEPAERERAVARALELGITYFDTASAYGKGQSEIHLGQAFKALKADAYVGTKVRLTAGDMDDIGGAITASLEASLQRLGMERVDVFQLHNRIGAERAPDATVLRVQDVIDEVVPAFQRLHQQGKIGFYGITALGETPALHRLIHTGVLDTAQVCFNLLNPSAGVAVPPGLPAQDFGVLLERTQEQNMGVIGIRALAAGALSGVASRHPLAMPSVAPIASGPDYSTDVERAQLFNVLVEEGEVESLVEASLRFPISHPGMSTVLLGYSNLEHLELAAKYVARGPLSHALLSRLTPLWQQLADTAEPQPQGQVSMVLNIPVGEPYVILPDDPDNSAAQVAEAQTAFQAGKLDAAAYRERLNTITAQHPTCLSAWASLGELVLPDDVIAAYAFFRVGYHRGLDRGRANGWNGSQKLRWEHETNRGFLRCLYGVMLAATAIGEQAEATRTRNFLLDLDPSDHFEVARS